MQKTMRLCVCLLYVSAVASISIVPHKVSKDVPTKDGSTLPKLEEKPSKSGITEAQKEVRNRQDELSAANKELQHREQQLKEAKER